MRGSTSVGYDQFETSPEAIEQELRPAVCERRLTDRLKTNYSIDSQSGTTFTLLKKRGLCFVDAPMLRSHRSQRPLSDNKEKPQPH